MKKSSIISLSILGILIALIGVLFGAVFCLRSQCISVLGNDVVIYSKTDIISAANLKKGQSIFMIDKETAISNIESKFPYVKVVQIKTTSVTEIEFRIRSRHEMFYTEYGNKFFILDEDLKVLDIIEKNDQVSNEPTNLIHIETGSLKINKETKICDFVGTKQQKQTIYELYRAVTNNVKNIKDGKKIYYSRDDMRDILKDVQFEKFNTFNKIIITTKYGVKLDIENPIKNTANKMSVCFATIEALIEEAQDREKSGTIKIYYDLNNQEKCIYISE